MDHYIDKLAYMIAMVLLVIGALNWGIIGLSRMNPVEKVFGKLSRLIYVLVGLAAVFVMFRRNFYLPFLGKTVIPCAALSEKTPTDAKVEVHVQVKPYTKLIYWASEPETNHLKTINDWRKAYLKFENAGITVSDKDGIATLKVRDPQPYTVPLKGRLESHVHYRVCYDNGMLGQVKTVYVKDENEAFTSSESYEFNTFE